MPKFPWVFVWVLSFAFAGTFSERAEAIQGCQTLKCNVDKWCGEKYGPGYTWNGNGDGTSSAPYQCTNGTTVQLLVRKAIIAPVKK